MSRIVAGVLLGITAGLAIAASASAQETDGRLTLFIMGDSTVKNNTAGQQGWGDPLAEYFDNTKINVLNRAIGGRSSRTFLTEGRKKRRRLQTGSVVLPSGGSL
jgi:lysophospholipase L1-like esterase